MARYAIWDKVSPVFTPDGRMWTAEQWIARHAVAGLETVTVICAAGEINGGFFGTLGQMEQMYGGKIDFSAYETAEEKLAAVESYLDEMETAVGEPTAEERTATALEAIAAGQTTENAEALDILLTGEEA